MSLTSTPQQHSGVFGQGRTIINNRNSSSSHGAVAGSRDQYISYFVPCPESQLQFIKPRQPALTMSGKLSGKVAIVTGGAGGFGKGIAEKFKQEGAEVIIADFVEEAGLKTASELKCEFQKCNVTSRQDWEALLKFADEKFGKVDCVVSIHASSYDERVRRLTDFTADQQRRYYIQEQSASFPQPPKIYTKSYNNPLTHPTSQQTT